MGFPTRNMNIATVDIRLDGIGTPGTGYAVAPCDGKIVWIGLVLNTAVDGANTLTTAIAGTAITGGAVTTGDTDAAGTEYTLVPTGANSVKRGQKISLATDGGGTIGQVQATFVIDQQG